jgi:taurine dioxygenase
MELIRAGGALGAYVSECSVVDAVQSEDAFAELQAAVVDHQVVFLRDQRVTPAVFERFARRFGPVLAHPAYPLAEGTTDVQILESTAENPSKIERWHSDMTFSATPPSFTLLHAQIVPAFGGDTLWASAEGAYSALSGSLRDLVDQLTAVHDFRHGFQESLAEPGGAERLARVIAANPAVEHPLVRTHPLTGRKSLYVNGLFTTRIKELTPLESAGLLEFLIRHTISEEFTVRLAWQPYTLAIWDNCSTQHKPVNDFFPQHRLMHRVTIEGGRPI